MNIFNKRNNKLLIVVGLLLITVLLVGMSYAYYVFEISQEGQNVVKGDCFKITFKDKNVIELDKTFPLTEEEGKKLVPYEFTIKNICSLAANYQVNLETLNTSTLDTLYLRSRVDENPSEILAQKEMVSTYVNDNAKESRKLVEGILVENEEITYKLGLWLDKDATIQQGANKIWKGKVVVITTLNKDPYRTIALNTNGGEISDNSVKIVQGRVMGTLPSPTKNGYTFNGWFDKEENGNQITEYTVVNENTEIYAYWNINTYDLVVNPNGGTWQTYTSAQTFPIEYNATMNIEDPTKTGHHFTGWTLSGTGSTFEDKVFKMGYENASLVANYEKNTYRLTVNPDGGEWNGSLSSQDFNILYNDTKEIPEPVREGYKFKGWDVIGSGSYEENNTFTMGYEDATLTAKWEINDYPYIVYHYKENITDDNYTLVDGDTYTRDAAFDSEVSPTPNSYTGFVSPSSKTIRIKTSNNVIEYQYSRLKSKLIINPNGGKYNGNESNTEITDIKYESTQELLIPERVGYSFDNWSVTGAGSSISDNILTVGYENTTATANWIINTYTISYNANGGTVNPGSDQVNHGSTLNLPTPTRIGYDFDGWYTSSDGGTKVDNTTVWTSSQTIFAHWVIKEYTITFNANGGTVSPSSSQVYHGSTLNLPTPSYTKYHFDGWYTLSEDGDKVDNTTRWTSSQTIFAHWTKYNYTGSLASAKACLKDNFGHSLCLPANYYASNGNSVANVTNKLKTDLENTFGFPATCDSYPSDQYLRCTINDCFGFSVDPSSVQVSAGSTSCSVSTDGLSSPCIDIVGSSCSRW